MRSLESLLAIRSVVLFSFTNLFIIQMKKKLIKMFYWSNFFLFQTLFYIFIYTGDKPHSCELCNKKFALACNLRAHMKTHEGNSILLNSYIFFNIYFCVFFLLALDKFYILIFLLFSFFKNVKWTRVYTQNRVYNTQIFYRIDKWIVSRFHSHYDLL